MKMNDGKSTLKIVLQYRFLYFAMLEYRLNAYFIICNIISIKTVTYSCPFKARYGFRHRNTIYIV